MSFTPRSDQAAVRDEARILVERAGDHERRLYELVEATGTHVRQAEEALSDSLDETPANVDHLWHLLRTQLQQSRDEAAAVRQLSAEAHEQYVATAGFLTHLDRAFRRHEGHREPGPVGNGVLVADDYRQLRESLALILQHAGFIVRTATNGLEALLAAHEMRPAVILMDVSMPVLDGLEATRLIKAADATRHARIIAYTGNRVADDAPARKLFAAVLHKPISPAVIVATVQHVASL